MITNISLTIPGELLRKIDDTRGDVPRSRFIIRILESSPKIDSSIDSKRRIPVDNNSFEAKDQQVSIVNGVDREW